MGNDVYSTRVTLLDRVKDDDDSAWHEFCSFYWELIHGWARRMGCSDAQAQDVFQETIINLLRLLKGFEYDPSKGSFRAFLKTIVRRRVNDSFRRGSRYINASAFENNDENENFNLIDKYDYDTPPETIEEDVVWLDTILGEALRRAYQRIDETSYKSFCMYVLEQQPVETVMEVLSLERGTIYQQKSRFLTILKKEFHKLLLENGCTPETEQMNGLDDRIFSQAVARMVEGRSDLRNTLAESPIPEFIKNKLEFIKENVSSALDDIKEDSLLLTSDDSLNEIQPLSPNFTIGRSDKADLCLNKDGVSGLHTSITQTEKGWVIKDEASTNGTFLNGEKLTGPVLLKSGDVIQLGNSYSLIFCSI